MRTRDIISHWPRPLQPIGALLGYLPFSRALWRNLRPSQILGAALWKADESLRSLKLSLTSTPQRERLKQILETDSRPEIGECLVSITIPSRKLGHRDNHLKTVLNSFVRMTGHPNRCEILVKVDEDDDLAFFNGIKKRYPNVNLRFFVTPGRGGYAGFTHYYSYLVSQASPTSKSWLPGCDDVVFVREGWDLDVYDLIDREPVFVAGAVPFTSEIGIIGPIITKPKPVYGYGTEGAPIVSFTLLKALREASEDLDGWTPLGDIPNVDAFIASVLHILYQEHGINIYRQLDRYCVQLARKVSWTKSPDRVALFVETFDKFFSPTSIATRTQVVERMYQDGLFGAPAESRA